jgi:membrane protein DedA with SNARE-associated domain
MMHFVELALRHYYVLLFAATLVAQLGLPLPAAPLMLGAGALVLRGQLSGPLAVLISVVSFLLAHLGWFFAGRRRGAAALRLVCRISLEPDSCVRKTEDLFGRFGANLLLAAPFIPGLGLLATPLAGLSGMRLGRFLLLDGAGALLWATAYVVAGYLLGPQLALALALLQGVSGSVASGALLLVVAYLAWKLIDRWRLLRELRIARITPQELKRRLEAGEPLLVVDLRHEIELDADRQTLPGALRIAFEELDLRHGEIPRDREIALFCS